jgi:glycosyltransferase involved in cell wall biosynthesis
MTDPDGETRVTTAHHPLVRPRVRVLIVAPSLDILGGQAVQARRMVDALTDSTRVSASLLPVNPRLPRPLQTLQRIKYVRTLVTSIAYASSLLAHVPRCDVVHAFSASYFSYLLAPLPALCVARLFRKPTILNYRSGEAEDHLARWPISRWTIGALASDVIVPSGYLIDVFERFGLRANSIANFVPIERLPYRRRSPIAPRLFSNRNFEPLYNVACTIRAFRRVQDVHAVASLTLAGDGSQRADLEALVRRLELRNVKFVGKVDQAQMAALYDEHDVYVNSPNIDNMPGSILEAFACGLPVVTTNAGGIPYIVDDGRTGFLVDPDDDAAMAERILRLLEDPMLAEGLSSAARAECQTRYVWAKVQRLWEARYESLATNGRSV